MEQNFWIQFQLQHTVSGLYKNGLLIGDERHGIFQVKENSLIAELVIPFKSYTPIGRMVVVEDRFIFLQRAGHYRIQVLKTKMGNG